MPKPGATVRRTAENDPVGPKMHATVKLIANHGPYPSKNRLAKAVGPHGSSDYGYQTVLRCINAGLLAVDPKHDARNLHGQGAVVLTDKGRRYLENVSDE